MSWHPSDSSSQPAGGNPPPARRPDLATQPGSQSGPGSRLGLGSQLGLQIGQHVIAAVLIVVGVVRAIGDQAPIVLALLVGVVLLAWYTVGSLAGIRASTMRARVWLAALTALWLAAAAISPEFVWIAFLLWMLAGHLLPGWPAIGYSTVVFAVVVAAPVLHDGTIGYANVIGPLIGGVFALGISRGYLRLLDDAAERERLVVSLRQSQQDTADLQDELALTQRHSGAVAERTRLAGDIHDTVAQSVSSIRLLSHASADRATEMSAPAEAVETLRRIESLAAESLRDVRRIVSALAPAELADGALSAALGRMAERLRATGDLVVDLHVDGTIASLPASVEVALLRTAQSALANVRQHAAAGRVVVTLIDDDDEVRLDIIDDGRGFDPTSARPLDTQADSGYGIGLMRSRLQQLGGGLEIASGPGEGTALSAHLPTRVRAGES